MNRNKEFERQLSIEIKKARQLKGVSQAKMKQDTGINVARLESGTYSIELKTYLRICSYLDIDCAKILKYLKNQNKLTYVWSCN